MAERIWEKVILFVALCIGFVLVVVGFIGPFILMMAATLVLPFQEQLSKSLAKLAGQGIFVGLWTALALTVLYFVVALAIDCVRLLITRDAQQRCQLKFLVLP